MRGFQTDWVIQKGMHRELSREALGIIYQQAAIVSLIS